VYFDLFNLALNVLRFFSGTHTTSAEFFMCMSIVIFCCAEDVPQPTTGLDYQIARISTTISSADASPASTSAAAASTGGNSNGDGSHSGAAAAAVEVQEVQSTFQLWEIGGGRTMVRMTDICLTPESVQRAMAVIVVDLSKPARVVDDLQFWLGALKAQVRALLTQQGQNKSRPLSRVLCASELQGIFMALKEEISTAQNINLKNILSTAHPMPCGFLNN
jgi:hypothetical protein